jgi:hypothetical protein
MDRKNLSWARRIYHWTLTHGSHARSIWLLALASVGDFFIPALPTQSSVILLTLLQPQRSRHCICISRSYGGRYFGCTSQSD